MVMVLHALVSAQQHNGAACGCCTCTSVEMLYNSYTNMASRLGLTPTFFRFVHIGCDHVDPQGHGGRVRDAIHRQSIHRHLLTGKASSSCSSGALTFFGSHSCQQAASSSRINTVAVRTSSRWCCDVGNLFLLVFLNWTTVQNPCHLGMMLKNLQHCNVNSSTAGCICCILRCAAIPQSVLPAARVVCCTCTYLAAVVLLTRSEPGRTTATRSGSLRQSGGRFELAHPWYYGLC